MQVLIRTLVVTLIAYAAPLYAQEADPVVVSDGDITISRAEMAASLELIPAALRSAAATDVGERFELINNMLQVRKLAAQADQLGPEVEGYWPLHFEMLALKRNFIYKREQAMVQLPNPRALAQEYYTTQKDKYATRPELRASSHILLPSPPGLPREELRAKAQELIDELRAGADFEAMVEEYSGDPGSKARGGSLNAWMRFGDPNFTPPYSEALFAIDEVGGYSEVTDSQFGIHIIRLDGIQEGGYYSFEEVSQKIYQDISQEFRKLAAMEISAKYNITEDAFIDGDAMDELFAPYQEQ